MARNVVLDSARHVPDTTQIHNRSVRAPQLSDIPL